MYTDPIISTIISQPEACRQSAATASRLDNHEVHNLRRSIHKRKILIDLAGCHDVPEIARCFQGWRKLVLHLKRARRPFCSVVAAGCRQITSGDVLVEHDAIEDLIGGLGLVCLDYTCVSGTSGRGSAIKTRLTIVAGLKDTRKRQIAMLPDHAALIGAVRVNELIPGSSEFFSSRPVGLQTETLSSKPRTAIVSITVDQGNFYALVQ